jgi:low molecular weight protein-tyrosine phosphatase
LIAKEQRAMGEFLTRVRRTPDRVLHKLRRRKATEALRGRPRPNTLLVVCHGNICRSPLAAALLDRELAAFEVRVQSGGFIGFNRPPPAEAVAAAERHQVNLADHRSRLLTADVVRTADLIVVMDPVQRRLLCERFGRAPSDVIVLGDFDPAAIETRTIRDPVDQSRAVFDEVYERIASCVRELASVLLRDGHSR